MTEIEVFVAIIDNDGFTGAANKLKLSKSSVSKHIMALESRLGVTLLNRTTRNVRPTDIGLNYYEKCIQILTGVREADLTVTSMQSTPQGILKLSAAGDFGSNHLVGALTPFLKLHPKIKVHMTLDNQFVDLVSEGFDVSIRIGDLPDSSLQARKIATTQFAIVGSEDYFKIHGKPEKIDDLADHQLLKYSLGKNDNFWRIPTFGGDERQFRGRYSLSVNDGKSLMFAAEDGLGLAYLPCFIYGNSIRNGRLQKVLPDLKLPKVGIYIVYPPADYIQPKLRVFIDFLVSHFKDKNNEIW